MAGASVSLSPMAAPLRMLCRRAQSCFFSQKPDVVPSSFPTSVWWDMNLCNIPKGCDPSSIAGNITRALVKFKQIRPISFPISFSAYADIDRIDPKVEQGVSQTGINITHVPYSRDGHAVGTKIIRDLAKWIVAHPPPGNCLFLFQDEEVRHILEIMRDSGYEIVLSNPKGRDVETPCTRVWPSTSLLAGRTWELFL